MNVRDIQIIQARSDQQTTLAQLLEFYTYDLSGIFNLDLNDNGHFTYESLPLYWTDPNRIPFLIWVDQKLAGFALIQKGSPTDSAPDIWDVAEFFVLRKFRRAGAGQTAANWIWSNYPGSWQVRVLATNQNAIDFWQSAVTHFTNAPATPVRKVTNGKDWCVYRFESPTTAEL
jgi:predicted acetyltransferase